MNKLPLPGYDDASAFEDLANNPQTSSYPHFQAITSAIKNGYTSYVSAQAKPSLVQSVIISARQAQYMKKHYRSPPASLHYITEMREAAAHFMCPMCGSSHSGTLDHYLPQTSYAAYALFSKNLIPACKCNSKRGSILLGTNATERILHPYFDSCLNERLLTARFEDLGDVPRVSLAILVPPTHQEYAAIYFHVDTIVKRSSIQRFLEQRWSQFFRKPSIVVRELKNNISSESQLVSILENERFLLDEEHGGKNNWKSIFLSGLLEPGVVTWLLTRMSAPNRIPDSSLG